MWEWAYSSGTVALCDAWCRRLEAVPSVGPQWYPDNLKCSSVCPRSPFGAAEFTVQHARAVGQDMSPGKRVLLSTSKAVRSVELDVRDLGGHLDFTRRTGARALSKRVRDATHVVAAVGALLVGFHIKLGLIRGKYLPAGLHAVEASYVSASSLAAFRAALVRSVWSSKMPLANARLFLNCWTVRFVWTLLFTLSGLGSA